MNKTGEGMAKRKKIEAAKVVESGKERNNIHIVAFWGMAILLLATPFSRGLFFPAEQYKALIFMTIVFLLTWFLEYRNGNRQFFRNPLDYIVLALPLVYLIAAFNAVNKGPAVDEVAKNTLYFMAFWSVSRIVTSKEWALKIINVIYLAAVGLSLAGLLTATGLIHITDGFLIGRFYSAFQYPNALASYLNAAFIMGLYLWHRNDDYSIAPLLGLNAKNFRSPAWHFNFAPWAYTVFSYLICTVLVGTKSNGGLLVLLAVLALYFIFIKGSDRLRVFTHLVSIAAPAAATQWLFIKFALNNQAARAWLVVLAGLFLVLLLQYLISLVTRKGLGDSLWSRKLILVSCTAVVILAGGMFAYKYLSTHQELVTKAMAEFRLRNASERFYFYSDALKMVEERPITGWGGGGWQGAYRMYQGYLYNSNQVHSYYLQVLVETGIAGLAVVLGLWFMVLRLAHKLYRNILREYQEKLLACTVLVSALAIGMHAAIDFDLSLSALTLALFSLIGIMAGLYSAPGQALEGQQKGTHKYNNDNDKERIKNIVTSSAIAITSLIVIVLCGSFATAEGNIKEAASALKKGDVRSVEALLVSASKDNPFKPEYAAQLASFYAQRGNLDSAHNYAEKAVSLNKLHPTGYLLLSSVYASMNRPEDAVASAEKAVQLAPFDITNYNMLSQAYFLTGYKMLSGSNRQEAGTYLSKAVAVNDMIGKQLEKLGPEEKRLWNVAPMLAPSDYTNFYSGASYCLLGDYQKAEQLLKSVSGDKRLQAESLMWQSLAARRQGNLAGSGELIAQAKTLVPDAEKQFQYVFDLIEK